MHIESCRSFPQTSTQHALLENFVSLTEIPMISFLFLTFPGHSVLGHHTAPSSVLFCISDLFNKMPGEENRSGTSSLYPSNLNVSTLCGHPVKLRGAHEGLVTHKEPNAF